MGVAASAFPVFLPPLVVLDLVFQALEGAASASLAFQLPPVVLDLVSQAWEEAASAFLASLRLLTVLE